MAILFLLIAAGAIIYRVNHPVVEPLPGICVTNCTFRDKLNMTCEKVVPPDGTECSDIIDLQGVMNGWYTYSEFNCTLSGLCKHRRYSKT